MKTRTTTAKAAINTKSKDFNEQFGIKFEEKFHLECVVFYTVVRHGLC